MIGAQVSRYLLKRNSAHGDEFDVRFIEAGEQNFMKARETTYFSLQRPVTTGLLTKAHLLTPRIDDYDIRGLEMFNVSSSDTGMARTRYPTDHGVADFNGLASLTLISEK